MLILLCSLQRDVCDQEVCRLRDEAEVVDKLDKGCSVGSRRTRGRPQRILMDVGNIMNISSLTAGRGGGCQGEMEADNPLWQPLKGAARKQKEILQRHQHPPSLSYKIWLMLWLIWHPELLCSIRVLPTTLWCCSLLTVSCTSSSAPPEPCWCRSASLLNHCGL